MSSELLQVSITEIPDRDCVRRFSCGVKDIDRWVSEKAYKHHLKNRARVFCAVRRGSAVVVGFYSLSLSPVASNMLFGQDGDMYSDGHAPLVFVDWLGVQRSLQGNKIGSLLLIDALKRAYLVSRHIPIYGVALRSLNERTTKLYKAHGFVVREETTHPLMIIPTLTLHDLFSGIAQAKQPSELDAAAPARPAEGITHRTWLDWFRGR